MKDRFEKLNDLINVKIAQFLTQYKWVAECYLTLDRETMLSKMKECAMSTEFESEIMKFLSDLSDIKTLLIYESENNDSFDECVKDFEKEDCSAFEGSIRIDELNEMKEVFK